VRERPDHVRVDQRRSVPFAAVSRGGAHGAVRGEEVQAIHFLAKQSGETGHKLGHIAASGLNLHGYRDRIAVVFHQEEQRQPLQAGDVEGLPKLALAGGAFARGDQRDRARVLIQIATGLGASRGLHELRAGGRRAGDDVQFRRAPVRGHLPSAGRRVRSRSYGLQQHFQRGNTERQAQRPIAVVGINPILPRTQRQSRGHLHGLMSSAADLKIDAILALQRDLAVVQAAGEMHDPKRVNERLGIEASQMVRDGFTANGQAHYFKCNRLPGYP